MGLIMSVNECIRIADETLEQAIYQKGRLRSPAQKRANKRTIEYWTAVKYHLSRLKNHESNNEQA